MQARAGLLTSQRCSRCPARFMKLAVPSALPAPLTLEHVVRSISQPGICGSLAARASARQFSCRDAQGTCMESCWLRGRTDGAAQHRHGLEQLHAERQAAVEHLRRRSLPEACAAHGRMSRSPASGPVHASLLVTASAGAWRVGRAICPARAAAMPEMQVLGKGPCADGRALQAAGRCLAPRLGKKRCQDRCRTDISTSPAMPASG